MHDRLAGWPRSPQASQQGPRHEDHATVHPLRRHIRARQGSLGLARRDQDGDEFVAAAKDEASLPDFDGDDIPEVAFAGRSNVGKSSLINAVTLSSAARSSDVPGKTQSLNFYDVSRRLRVVDMPGYGFAFAAEDRVAAWNRLMDKYLTGRKNLKRVYVVVDARHGLKAPDREMLAFLSRYGGVSYSVVLNKTDLVKPADLARRAFLIREELRAAKRARAEVHMASTSTGAGMAGSAPSSSPPPSTRRRSPRGERRDSPPPREPRNGEAGARSTSTSAGTTTTTTGRRTSTGGITWAGSGSPGGPRRPGAGEAGEGGAGGAEEEGGVGEEGGADGLGSGTSAGTAPRSPRGGPRRGRREASTPFLFYGPSTCLSLRTVPLGIEPRSPRPQHTQRARKSVRTCHWESSPGLHGHNSRNARGPRVCALISATVQGRAPSLAAQLPRARRVRARD